MEGVRDAANRSVTSSSLPRPQDTSKRRLLLIYIHGFMGSGASFQDFPAHVHDLLTSILSESHVVYTRIYPRYKSYGELQAAVNQFSAWLSPHEADDLDVILLGHSLGGILAADVALLPAAEGQTRPKHRILGIMNFDVPFLGLHPRVIPTGIGSSMPKKDTADDKLPAEQESLPLKPPYKPSPPNPTFDPPFKNDFRNVQRGFLQGMLHFVEKNTDNLSRSIIDRVISPVKFANCVNNHSELRRRYRRLMELEAAEYGPERVRLINYYTASTGRISRKQKSPPINETEETNHTPPSQESSETPEPTKESEETLSTATLTPDEQNLKPTNSETTLVTEEAASCEKTQSPMDTPAEQKEESQSISESVSVSVSTAESDRSADPSKQKLRKFILLPSHHWRGNDNAHWTPILMEDMDEVAAHQSMFIPRGKNYEHLVGDAVSVIEQWVQSDMSRRLLQESLD